jgi:hypothetical protein
VNLTTTVDAPCAPSELFPWVDDLSRYPSWLTIVTRAEADGDEAWVVDLRGQVGPIARSKRLRMARTVLEPDRQAVFERAERDGRQHSMWALTATVDRSPSGSRLEMHLHYDGAFWGAVLERLLRDEIDESRQRLLDLVSGQRR